MTSTEPSGSDAWPSLSRSWAMVVLLTIAYIFSFVDRYILGLLIEPIKADLSLSDEQIGWLIGWAFAIFYATMGLPLGWLVDRKRRTWIVAAGIAVWSLATAASGLASKFWHLFLARMAVGAGEATLSPAAFSMIADSFPPDRRGKPIAFYSAALTLGAGLASLIGSAVISWAKRHDTVAVPLLGEMAPWQATFIAVGLPGVTLALVFLFLREPARRASEAEADKLAGNGLRDALQYVAANGRLFGGFVALVCVMTIIAYSQAFLPSTFNRIWGWEVEYYALVNGLVMLVIGPLSVMGTGYLSDRWSQKGLRIAPFRLLMIGYGVMLASGVLPYFMPSAPLAYTMLAINTVGIAMVSAVGVTALLMITPASIRGQMVALYYMVVSMAGLLLGPTTVGTLSTRLLGEENIHYALAAIPVIYGIVPALLLPGTYRLYKLHVEQHRHDQGP
ncbi:MFS transporter [Altererythrobacter sp. BO-6]|uniref:MFS transporter n=1 Tax=Altererythrobacter sp. BO-6 TaxID=2604537 RepID=UPI0013E1ECC9|nr:MFS transporter [Altererythrobacter sp. BO-6]QIG53586.1 MFS transporter [Altererythrobacter sp. BO-6]